MRHRIKLHVHVGSDRIVRLPSEFPEGPAEITAIVTGLSTAPAAPGRGQGMDAERFARSEFFIADDFDAPLPEEIQRYFDGDADTP